MIGIGISVLLVLAAMLVRCRRQPGVALAILLLFFPAKQLVQLSITYFADHGPYLNIAVFGSLGILWLDRLVRGRGQQLLGVPREYGAHLAFIGLALFSSLWSLYGEAGTRLLDLAPYVLVYALVGPSLLASTRGLAEALQWIFWFGGAMCALFLFGFGGELEADRLVLVTESDTGEGALLNPLAVGAMGAWTIITAALAQFPRSGIVLVLRLTMSAIALVTAARSARGELLGAIITVALLSFVPTSSSRRTGFSVRKLLTVLAAIGVGLIVLYYGLFLTHYWNRYEDIGHDESSLHRTYMISLLWDYWVNHPQSWIFGLGWTSSFALCGIYPHNGAFQALTEVGLIGGALWMASVLFVGFRGFQLATKAYTLQSQSLDVVRPVLGLMLATLLSNQKAGDCVDFWLALTLATVAQLLRRFRSTSEKGLLR